ncbi:uncharacterized protein PHACADRAFT_78567, partial [Phanerochaete carnosa HHB-10118-sp]
KHPKLYLEDGDLELSAEMPDGSRQLFRVSGAQLRCVSPVFSDMLALGGPRDEVVMMPDSAEDLAALLESVCIPSSLVRKLKTTPESQCAIELFGLAKIARKYGMDDITAVIVEHIQEQWPRSLEEWDASFATWRTNSKTAATRGDVPEPVSAIKFALEFDVPSILPAAFYMLSVQDFGDTTTASPGAESMPSMARWDLTDHAMLLKLICGRDKVRNHFKTYLSSLRCEQVANPQKSQSSIDACNHAKNALLGSLMRGDSAFYPHGQWDYLEILRLVQLYKPLRERFCCLYTAKTVSTARVSMWEKLPEYFGI